MTIMTNLWIFQRYGVRYGVSEIAIWSFLSFVLLITFYLYVTIKVIIIFTSKIPLLVLLVDSRIQENILLRVLLIPMFLGASVEQLLSTKLRWTIGSWLKLGKGFEVLDKFTKLGIHVPYTLSYNWRFLFPFWVCLCRFVYRMHHFQHSRPWNA